MGLVQGMSSEANRPETASRLAPGHGLVTDDLNFDRHVYLFSQEACRKVQDRPGYQLDHTDSVDSRFALSGISTLNPIPSVE